MLSNVHVGWQMADPKVIQKTCLLFHKIMWAAIRLLATGQQANISIKVEIFSPSGYQGLLRFFKIINILYQSRVKVNIQNNPTLLHL